jgi:hypothetical protein
MPGLASCVRCRSALVAAARIDVHPPRAGRLKVLRVVRYWLNRQIGLHRIEEQNAAAVERVSDFLPFFASALPGLGHLLTKSCGRIRLVWPLWAGCLAFGLIFYGTIPAGVAIGVAAALHAWIACDAIAVHRLLDAWVHRFAAVLLAFCVLLFGLYGGVRRLAGRAVRGVFAAVDVPEARVRAGDYVLVWRNAYAHAAPRRGDIVLYEMQGGPVSGDGRGHAAVVVRTAEVLSPVLARPGDAVEVGNGRLRVLRDGCQVGERPAPRSLAAARLALSVPAGHYLCMPPELARAGGDAWSGAVEPHRFLQLGLTEPGAIRGRAFMVYNPIWRRRWIAHRSRALAVGRAE